ERDALVGFGAAVGLALDNARLAARQRRFAEELEHKVGEATARLGEMDRLKSGFVALASHELRTPLTALQGFSELLATRAFAPLEVRRLAEIMRGEIERLGRIVSDFLDLARLERGLAPALRRARVFGPCYRVRETAGLGPGTGLGLSVVKSLVEAHGGTVRADAAPGCGTRMTVMLPALP